MTRFMFVHLSIITCCNASQLLPIVYCHVLLHTICTGFNLHFHTAMQVFMYAAFVVAPYNLEGGKLS